MALAVSHYVKSVSLLFTENFEIVLS